MLYAPLRPTYFALLVMLVVSFFVVACSDEISYEPELFPQPAIFEREQAPADQLPSLLASQLATQAEGLDFSSSRFLGTSGNWQYWGLKNQAGDYCLLIGLSQADCNIASSFSCTEILAFYKNGASTTLQSGSQFSAAVFTPDGFTNAIARQLPTADVKPNVVAFTELDALTEAAQLPAESLTFEPQLRQNAAPRPNLSLNLPALLPPEAETE
jgi:hypothetical protein